MFQLFYWVSETEDWWEKNLFRVFREIVRPTMTESSALGAAMAAGNAEGIDVWCFETSDRSTITSDIFTPTITAEGKKTRIWNEWASWNWLKLGKTTWTSLYKIP